MISVKTLFCDDSAVPSNTMETNQQFLDVSMQQEVELRFFFFSYYCISLLYCNTVCLHNKVRYISKERGNSSLYSKQNSFQPLCGMNA